MAKIRDNSRQGFITLFDSIARHKHRYTVFTDFVTLSAIALHNAVVKSEKLENEYLEIIAKYSKEEAMKFSELLGIFIILLNVEPVDILGTLYMELELGNLKNGQFFTPHEISLLMAKVVYGDVLNNLKHSNKPFITLSEPTCGAGGMVLAFANEMRRNKINPAEKLFVQCIDIDRLAGLMCYIQLSLWYIPAEIIIGDTLSLEFREVYYTPAYYLGNWQTRLRLRNFLEICEAPTEAKISEPKQDHDSETLPHPSVQTTNTDEAVSMTVQEPIQTATHNKKPKSNGSTSGIQVDLFDFTIDH